MRASRGGERRLSAVTRDDWVSARHTIITALAPRASTLAFVHARAHVCVYVHAHLARQELHVSEPHMEEAGVMGTMTSRAAITPRYKLVI